MEYIPFSRLYIILDRSACSISLIHHCCNCNFCCLPRNSFQNEFLDCVNAIGEVFNYTVSTCICRISVKRLLFFTYHVSVNIRSFPSTSFGTFLIWCMCALLWRLIERSPWDELGSYITLGSCWIFSTVNCGNPNFIRKWRGLKLDLFFFFWE